MSFVNNILNNNCTITVPTVQPKVDDTTVLIELCKCNDNIPATNEFKGTYKYDYNILNIHNSILHNFNNYYTTEVQKYCNEINDKLLIDSNSDVSELKSKLTTLEMQVEKTKYLQAALPYLLSYKKLKPITIRISQRDCVPGNNEDSDVRHEIISKYIEIAASYITINLVRIFENVNLCKQCANTIPDNEFLDDLCPFCGAELINIFKHNNSTSEIKSNNKSSNDYINFEKAILRLQGKQVNKLPEKLWPALEKYFTSYGLYTSNIVQKWEYDSVNDCKFFINEKKNRVIMNREIMEEALRKTEFTDYYNDMNLILHLYWAFPLPNIESVLEGIREDFPKTQQVFNEIEKTRTSNMNSDFRLMKQLELRKFPFKRTWFKIIKTPQIRNEYEILWRKMCEGAGLEYIPTKW